MTRRWSFWVAFAAATLLIAGVVSYFASSSPDGLDSTTLRGCEVVETSDGEQLTGDCIAQNASEHHLSDSPLADYAIGGREGSGGVAGVLGVLVTLAVAGGGFWLIARTRSAATDARRRRRHAEQALAVGAGAHPLYRHGDSAVHRAPAEVKIVCLLVFVLAVVATPREMFWPFAIYAVIVVSVWRLARIPLRWVLPRMLIEAPFLVLALLLPFAEGGERVEFGGLQLSVAGLYAAWGIVVKGTLGVAAALTLAATTAAAELPAALSRLGVPAVVTSVLVLMIRYIDLLAAEAGRMRMARISRGDSPRALHQARAIASGIGALFLRSYERGERVYHSMLSRGFDGAVPDLAVIGAPPRAVPAQWAMTMIPAVAAVAVSVLAWVI